MFKTTLLGVFTHMGDTRRVGSLSKASPRSRFYHVYSKPGMNMAGGRILGDHIPVPTEPSFTWFGFSRVFYTLGRSVSKHQTTKKFHQFDYDFGQIGIFLNLPFWLLWTMIFDWHYTIRQQGNKPHKFYVIFLLFDYSFESHSSSDFHGCVAWS